MRTVFSTGTHLFLCLLQLPCEGLLLLPHCRGLGLGAAPLRRGVPLGLQCADVLHCVRRVGNPNHDRRAFSLRSDWDQNVCRLPAYANGDQR